MLVFQNSVPLIVPEGIEIFFFFVSFTSSTLIVPEGIEIGKLSHLHSDNL